MKLNPKLLLDVMYPVGSYYETSNASFNPNTEWGGTWVEDTKGRVTVALDSNDTDFNNTGKTGGSKELQKHAHSITPNGYSVDLNATGVNYNVVSGTRSSQVDFFSSGEAGTGNSGNLQPYVVVKRWHRTA